MVCLFEHVRQLSANCNTNRALYSNNHGYALFWKFRRIAPLLATLNAAVTAFEEAVDRVSVKGPDRLLFLLDLADALGERFEIAASEEEVQKLEVTTEKIAQLAAADDTTKAVYLNRLGDAFRLLFETTKMIGALDSSIQAYDRALGFASEGGGSEILLSSLGKARFSRYEQLGQPEDLDKAIGALRAAELAVPSNEPLFKEVMNLLGCALRVQFELTGNQDSLHGAVEVNKKLLDHLDCGGSPQQDGNNVQERAITLSNLGACLTNQFDEDGSLATLNAAITVQQEAVNLLATDQSRPVSLAGLAESYRRRYDALGEAGDIEAAVRLGREAVAVVGLDEAFPDEYPLMLTNFALALVRRYELLGSVDDLEDSMRYSKSAEKASRDKPTVYPLCCNNRSYCMIASFYRSGTVADINEAAAMSKKAVSLATGNPRVLLMARNNSCRASMEQLQLGLPTEIDLTELATMVHQMVLSVPSGHPERPLVLNCRALVRNTVFEQTGSADDLDLMIESLEEAVRASSLCSGATQAFHLRDLAEGLATRFEWIGELNDLNGSIDAAERSKEHIPETHPQYALHLMTLGRALTQRASHTSSADDFNSAIHLLEQAGRVLPEKHPKRGACLNNLATALGLRSLLVGTTDDLNAAIQCAMKATSAFSGDFPDKAVCLTNLGQIVAQRFSRAGWNADIDIAVESHAKALQLTADRHWRYINILENLSSALLMRFQSHRRRQDLDEAVKHSRKTLELCSPTSQERARYLANASRVLLEVAKSQDSSSVETSSGAKSSLEEAVGYVEEAAQLSVGDENQSRPEILLAYASCLEMRIKQSTVLPSDRQTAVDIYRQVLDSARFPIGRRVAAAISAAELLYPEDVETGSRMLAQAVHLLPRLISRSLLRSDQQFVLSQIPELAANAAALEMRTKKRADEAVRLLELGHLARRFKDVQERLGRSEEDVLLPDIRSFLQSQAARRYSLAQEMDCIVAEIRQQPGFEQFLLGPLHGDLTRLAAEGPLVYLNVSRYGSAAFVITTEKVHALPLERLKYDTVVDKAQKLSDIRDNDNHVKRRLNNAALNRMLRWLWDDVVDEVLRALHFTPVGKPGNQWPRIWWIPVGLLSLFPIHAARSKEGVAVLDHVISSYATTVRSLHLARERFSAHGTERLSGGGTKVCLVSMKTTPERTDLPHAEAETQSIAKLLPFATTILAQPTKKQVLESIQRCSAVHFACHGEMHADPSRSRILLCDWEHDPFSVHDMAAANLIHQEAKLAYLSACHAGTTKNVLLLDEAMHMTGACQLAGFPAVIGTLWKVLDEYAPVVARDVYQGILDPDQLDVGRTAQALHFAVLKLRKQVEGSQAAKPNPIAWAPYIYVGV
ncbi:CHAT domain-containing protein [Lasiosphaeris hirsuta]|uniref:CHAT domain-containing protein n=1 Tax=Lasiosphaeris hirsuta TaxID=260670 RepID=A0AA40A2D0_9PEZI|nr:CHAT domain-containing protein [Lasiosphaeris hirsuta]